MKTPFPVGYGVDAVLTPKSIAVIGVSGDSRKKEVTGGTGVLNNLLRFGYTGQIYPVNPKYDAIMGLRCYSSISEIPEAVDLAVISVAAESVPHVLAECGRNKCKAAVIISSGFAEVQTPRGIELQEEVAGIAAQYGIRMLGPNNLGCYNVHDRIVCSTSAALFYYDNLIPGGIAWVTQSGALGSTLYGRAIEQQIGFSYVVTSGNECDLQTADFVWYMADDPRVHVIGLYIEGIRDWKKFEAAAEKARRAGKPIIAYKTGITPCGAAAVKAHTSSDAGSIDEYRRLFQRTGVLMAESLEELYQTAYLMDMWRNFGDVRSAAIITTSGGSGGILADGLTLAGIDVARLDKHTTEKIQKIIPEFGSAVNPIDVTAHMMRTPEKLWQIGKVLEESPEVDAIIYAPTTLAPASAQIVAHDFARLIRNSRKPGLVHWYSSALNAPAIQALREDGIPVFTDGHALFRALRRRKDFFAFGTGTAVHSASDIA